MKLWLAQQWWKKLWSDIISGLRCRTVLDVWESLDVYKMLSGQDWQSGTVIFDV